MIDLHLHTTASDGRCSPQQLVAKARAAGVTVLAVTDHDTVAATRTTAELCAAAGLQAVSGIEVTALENGRDVHVLGYFLDPGNERLQAFLAAQRADRVARVQAIAARLASLGMPVDVTSLIRDAETQHGRSIGRPQVARAMVAAGYAADTREAFDRWLGGGKPAFVPRSGSPPECVIEILHEAGGLASLAHPGVTAVDDRIAVLRDAGLDALEAYHSDHPPEVCERYKQLAARFGMLVTGGSDYHGDPAHGVDPGCVALPRCEWQRLIRWQPRSSR